MQDFIQFIAGLILFLLTASFVLVMSYLFICYIFA
jgi:hypothetical protein